MNDAEKFVQENEGMIAVADAVSRGEIGGNAVVNPIGTVGIYGDISNEAYHSGPGISKSGLWTIYSKSPAHFRYEEREQKSEFDVGAAIHTAILEPMFFEDRVMRGPDDRRGNKWKDAAEYAASEGKLLLTSGDYDDALAVRDAVHADNMLNQLIVSPYARVEQSVYWIDEITGELCRARPDLWRPDLALMIDLKSTTSAHPDAFARSVVDYGYHAQEAFYSDGLDAAGAPIAGTLFIAVEKKTPYVSASYELPPSIVEEGRAIMRQALDTYAACCAANHWPGYAAVAELKFPRWAYKVTQPQIEEAV